VRPEGFNQLKNPLTSSAIKPATFRLVAQWPPECFTHYEKINGCEREQIHIKCPCRDVCAFSVLNSYAAY
jgi:hypothetical protein